MSSFIDPNAALSAKVIIIGESNVGKSCLINRFVNNKFKELEPTIGLSYSNKQVHVSKLNKSINFDIWDTSGQEKYRSLNKIFYKDARVALLVYDITSKKSFEELRKFWLNELVQNATENIGKLVINFIKYKICLTIYIF